MGDKHSIASATTEIFDILRALDSPRDAARALAGAHLMLIEADDAPDEAGVRERLKESSDAIIKIWRERAGVPQPS